MLKIVVFNGPARSGKNIAAEHMCEISVNSYHKAFKDELFKICANTLGISVETFKDGYDETLGEVSKRRGFKLLSHEDPNMWFKDYTGNISQRVRGEQYSKREFLIHMSENVIKPSFGKDAFGKAFVNSLPEEGVVFVSDSGFKEELQPVIDHVGADNVLVIRLVRDGCSFDGDSRDYLTPEMFEDKVQFYQIVNNGTEQEFLDNVEECVNMWLSYAEN